MAQRHTNKLRNENIEMKGLLKLFIFWHDINDCNKPLYQDQFDAAMMRAKELTKE